jgi:hypothetical protein
MDANSTSGSEPQQPLRAATSELIAEFVRSATRRLVVLAPAVSLHVAVAIRERWFAIGANGVTITLDVDPEVYRLGYGDAVAMEGLEQTGREVGGLLQRHPGIRIGVVIADDRVLVYSPVPQLVEAGPRDAAAPNAVVLGPPPVALENALGVGDEGHRNQTIGLDKAKTDDIATLQENLRVNPPQRFDVARRIRVFNAAFQFVELAMSGTSIGRRTVQIPSHLLGVADAKTREQLRTVLRIVPTGHALSGDNLERLRRGIERDHLKPIPGFGQALPRTRKEAFERKVELLKERVEEFKAEVSKRLQEELTARVGELETALMPRLTEAPPSEWLLPGDEPARTEALRAELHRDLERAMGSVEGFVGDMRVTVVYKDVTYESLTDEKFLTAARKVFPDLPQLHAEYDAAPTAVGD